MHAVTQAVLFDSYDYEGPILALACICFIAVAIRASIFVHRIYTNMRKKRLWCGPLGGIPA